MLSILLGTLEPMPTLPVLSTQNFSSCTPPELSIVTLGVPPLSVFILCWKPNVFQFVVAPVQSLVPAIKYGKSQGLKNTHIELLTYIYKKFKTLAFCPRWIKQAPNRICLSKLISTNIIKEYPPICDIPESFIAQHEKTVFVSRDGPIILN